MSKTNMIDPDTIGQLVVEGIGIIHQHHGYADETAEEKKQAIKHCAERGEPFARLQGDLDGARDLLDDRAIALDANKRLRVSIAHEALDGILAHYYPES